MQLKELLETEIAAERRLRDALRAADVEALKARDDAIAHRLHVLNDAHSEARRIITTYLQIVVFEEHVKSYAEWKGKLDREHAVVMDNIKDSVIERADIRQVIGKLEADFNERSGRLKLTTTIFTVVSITSLALGVVLALIRLLHT
jgi:hypothetical protein